jgi:hypothetical protein
VVAPTTSTVSFGNALKLETAEQAPRAVQITLRAKSKLRPPLRATLIDFTARQVTDDTYTVFVTSSCVVLLVWDLSRDDIFDVKSQIEALQAFASACPIVLVGSHSDLPQCTVEHTDRMFRKVLAALGPSHSANIHKCIPVSTVNGENVRELRQLLEELVSNAQDAILGRADWATVTRATSGSTGTGSPLRRSTTGAGASSGAGSPGSIRRSSGAGLSASSAAVIAANAAAISAAAPLMMSAEGSQRRRLRREMLADVLTAEARFRAVPIITWRELLVLARKIGMRSAATVLDAVRALHSDGRVWHSPLTAIGGVVELLDPEATVLKDKLVKRTSKHRSSSSSTSSADPRRLSADGVERAVGHQRSTRAMRVPSLRTIDENATDDGSTGSASSFVSATDSDDGKRLSIGSVLSTSTSASLDATDNSGCASSSDDSHSDDSSLSESSSQSEDEPLLFARPPLSGALSGSPLRRSTSTNAASSSVTTVAAAATAPQPSARPHLTAAQLNEADGLLVLSVQWLMTGLSRLLADDACKDPDVRKPAGVLQVSDAARILSRSEYPPSVHPLLFAVMMSRNIAFRLPSGTGADAAELGATALSRSARHRAMQYADGHYIKPSTLFWIPRLSTVARPDMSLTWPPALPALGVAAAQRMRTPGLRRLRCVVHYEIVPPRCVAQLVSELTVPLTRVWSGGALLTSVEQRILVELRMQRLTVECEGVRDVDALADTVRTVYELLDRRRSTAVDVLLACTSCLVHARGGAPHEFALAHIERAVLSGATALDCPLCGTVELTVLAPHVTLAHRPDLLMRKTELRLSTKEALAVTADAVVRKARLGEKRVAIKRLQIDPESSDSAIAAVPGEPTPMEAWWRELRCLLSLTPDKLNAGAECVVRPIAFSFSPPMIALPLAPHGDLYNWLRSPAADHLLRWPLRLRMALDLARGLEFLHALTPPLIHGDFKSPNCLVFGTDVAHTCLRITDFGCSTHTASLLCGSRAADTVANPTWAAPETRAGVLVARGDVYALGIVLWELATRRHPFALNDERPTAFMASLELDILRGRRPPLPSGLPRAFAHAMTECWRPLRFRPNAAGARALVEAAALGCGLHQRAVNAMTLGRSGEALGVSRIVRHRLHETGAVAVPAPVAVQCALLVPQRDQLWIGARSGGLLVYDVQSGALRHRVPLASGSLDALALHGDHVWGVGSESVHVWEAVAFVSRTHSSALHLLEADGSDRAHVFVLETGAIYRQIAHGTRTVELALTGAKITELVKREFRFTVRAADGTTRAFRAPSFSVYSGWVAALGDEIMLRSLPPVKSLWSAPVTRNRVGLPLVAPCAELVWFAGIAPSGESAAPAVEQLTWIRDAAELERSKSALLLVGFGAAANAEGAFVARHNLQLAASGAASALTSAGGELWIGTSGSRRGSDVYRVRWSAGVPSVETLPLASGDGGVAAIAVNVARDTAWACTASAVIYAWSLASNTQKLRFALTEWLPARVSGAADAEYEQRSQAPVLCCFADNTVLYGDRLTPTVLTVVNEGTVSAASLGASAASGITGIANVNDCAAVVATVHSFHWLTA